MSDKKRERMTEEEISPNGHGSLDWDQVEPGAQITTQGSCLRTRGPSTSASSAALTDTFTRLLAGRREAGVKDSHVYGISTSLSVA